MPNTRLLAAALLLVGTFTVVAEERHGKSDGKLPIAPPIRAGYSTPQCQDEPTEAEVLQALPRSPSGAALNEPLREDIEIVNEKLVDKIDPARVFPLVGPAQLHHCHWKCTVYWTETIQSSQSVSGKVKRKRVEVVYIDKDFLHACAAQKQDGADCPKPCQPQQDAEGGAQAFFSCCPHFAGWLTAEPEREIAFELRIVSVSEMFFERMGFDPFDSEGARGRCEVGRCNTPAVSSKQDKTGEIHLDFGDCGPAQSSDRAPARTALLKDWHAWLLIDACQRDSHFSVMQAPKLTAADGQTGAISMMDCAYFVTGINFNSVDGEVRAEPKTVLYGVAPGTPGLKAEICGSVTKDGRCVQLKMNLLHMELENAAVPVTPVTVMVPAKKADGKAGPPVPFTQMIQHPKFNTLFVDADTTIPAGCTLLIDAGKVLREEVRAGGPPVMSKIPYVNRLFKTASHGKVCDHVLVLVTPRILCDSDAACCPPCRKCEGCPACPGVAYGPCDSPRCKPCPAGEEESSLPAAPAMKAAAKVKSAVEQRAEKKAAKLVLKYHEACLKGEPEKARKYARQALDLDPECFTKPHEAVAPVTSGGCLEEPQTFSEAIRQLQNETAPISGDVLKAVQLNLEQRLPARFATMPCPPTPAAPRTSDLDNPGRCEPTLPLPNYAAPKPPPMPAPEPPAGMFENVLKAIEQSLDSKKTIRSQTLAYRCFIDSDEKVQKPSMLEGLYIPGRGQPAIQVVDDFEPRSLDLWNLLHYDETPAMLPRLKR